MNLFFEDKKAFEMDVKDEIGARSMRRKKSDIVVPKFYSDMTLVFENINRVLKKDGFLALIIGQGKSKVVAGYDIIGDFIEILQSEIGFSLLFSQDRQIGNRVIQVGGVDKERILLFQK